MQVEQIDRDAAANAVAKWYNAEENPRYNFAKVVGDDHYFTQAFARHRHQARAEVVREIVAWLQDHDFGNYIVSGVSSGIADEIEAEFGGRDAQ